MAVIESNLNAITEEIKNTAIRCGRDQNDINLIAVSKRKSAELILKAIDAGAFHFGENYIQEAMEKIDAIGIDRACWHFIGHLQSNKAKFAVKYFEYIHTVDSVKLAKEINKQACKIDKIQKVFIQVNISHEATKSGTSSDDLLELIRSVSEFENIRVNGLMCMPPFFQDPEDARKYFKELADLKETIMSEKMANIDLQHLSMGMSNDFKVAIQEGSTMVRVGTSIFGARD